MFLAMMGVEVHLQGCTLVDGPHHMQRLKCLAQINLPSFNFTHRLSPRQEPANIHHFENHRYDIMFQVTIISRFNESCIRNARNNSKRKSGMAKKSRNKDTVQSMYDNLSRRIQHLPQELYDKILDYTVAVDDISEIEICRSYKPPAQLQINRVIRDREAASYYANTKFTCNAWTLDQCAQMLGEWLRSIPVKHVCMIQNVGIATPGKQVDGFSAARSYIRALLGQHRRRMREKLRNDQASASENSCKITVLVGRRKKPGRTGYSTGRYDMTWTLLPDERAELNEVLQRGRVDGA